MTTCTECNRIYNNKTYCPTCGFGYTKNVWSKEYNFHFQHGLSVTETGLFRRPASFITKNLCQSLLNVRKVSRKGKVSWEPKVGFRIEANFLDSTWVWEQNKYGAFDVLYVNFTSAFHPLIHRHDASEFPDDQKYTTVCRFKGNNLNDSDAGSPAIVVFAQDEHGNGGPRIHNLYHTNGILTKVEEIH